MKMQLEGSERVQKSLSEKQLIPPSPRQRKTFGRFAATLGSNGFSEELPSVFSCIGFCERGEDRGARDMPARLVRKGAGLRIKRGLI